MSRFYHWVGCVGVLLLLLALTGCLSVRRSKSPPKVGAQGSVVTSAALQAQVQRFADSYVAMVSQGCDNITRGTTNWDVRLAALRWQLGQATAAYNDATGENPSVNALDLLVLATIARGVVQEYGAATYGTNLVQPLLRAQIAMESNAWTMASVILSPSQQAELRGLIQQWRQEFPHQHVVGAVHFRELATALGQAPERRRNRSGSIFSLLNLNPLSGLDPATAAIEGIRQLGERTMYYTQRMPTLLNWQTQLLVYQLASQPESTQMLANMNQFAATAAVISKTGKQLPQIINDQRQAAIQQILDGLVAEENKSGQLLINTRLTLDSASTAASNINTALLSLTEFVRYVSPTNSSPKSPGTNSSPPFNVLNYGKAASQIGAAANNLNALLTTANQSLPQIDKVSARMTDNANAVVHHAFMQGLVLIIILLAGSVVAGLVYRILADKLVGRSKQ